MSNHLPSSIAKHYHDYPFIHIFTLHLFQINSVLATIWPPAPPLLRLDGLGEVFLDALLGRRQAGLQHVGDRST